MQKAIWYLERLLATLPHFQGFNFNDQQRIEVQSIVQDWGLAQNPERKQAILLMFKSLSSKSPEREIRATITSLKGEIAKLMFKN